MKFISLILLLVFSFSTSIACFGQKTSNSDADIKIEVVDENNGPLQDVEVTIRGIIEPPGKKTDYYGQVFISMSQLILGIGQELEIECKLEGYRMRETPFRYTIKDPSRYNNFVRIYLYKRCCGIPSFKEYIKKQSLLSIGFGFGYRQDECVILGDIPKKIRTIPPHTDDVLYRPDEILDPFNPDNYVIIYNAANVALSRRISFDLYFCFWGIFNIAISTSEIRESEVEEGVNLFRKSYIKEGAPGGDALIYYLVRIKSCSFLYEKSFSLPIYIQYPILFFGRNKQAFLTLMAGTNALLPNRISLQAERGWHRFNERQKKDSFELGDLKEINYFTGLDIKVSPTRSLEFGMQILLVYTDYQEDFEYPLSLEHPDKALASVRFHVSKLF